MIYFHFDWIFLNIIFEFIKFVIDFINKFVENC